MTTTLIIGANKGLGYGDLSWSATRSRPPRRSTRGRSCSTSPTTPPSRSWPRPSKLTAGWRSWLTTRASQAGGGPRDVRRRGGHRDIMAAIFDTNAFGVVRVTHAFLPLLLASAAPVIVNVSSALGLVARMTTPGTPAFTSATYSPTAVSDFAPPVPPSRQLVTATSRCGAVPCGSLGSGTRARYCARLGHWPDSSARSPAGRSASCSSAGPIGMTLQGLGMLLTAMTASIGGGPSRSAPPYFRGRWTRTRSAPVQPRPAPSLGYRRWPMCQSRHAISSGGASSAPDCVALQGGQSRAAWLSLTRWRTRHPGQSRPSRRFPAAIG